MSVHQIIYTSCMRGINGVNDGQQVFSYDEKFGYADNDEVKSLFAYQSPMLESGVIMTEELAKTFPKAFIFRKVDNGKCALALNTYIGRDYMGSAGRFGNHISHVVLADECDIKNYPCEFYGSSMLRNHMEFEEVNNPEKPDFLPEPVLERGFTVDIDAVTDFLSADDRIEIFKNMLYAVLAFDVERKRTVICDEPENIIMWIAAIEYTLPLKIALNINFSTYDFDPSLSASQICGVIPKGSRYTAESQRLNFVFDLYENNCAEFEKDELYFDFIDTAMSFSYDSLQDFHRFISKGYSYEKADEKMYAAYYLYSFLSDGILGLTEKKIKTALNFADEYALPAERLSIIQNLFEQKDCLLRIDIKSFICIMRYIISKYGALSENHRNVIKSLVVDRVLYEFINNESGENAFISFYNEIDSVCKESGFNVASELMIKSNREKLTSVMKNEIGAWKITFIVRAVSAFVKERCVTVDDLLTEAPLGHIYYDLVQAAYLTNARSGFFLVTRILDEFSDNCEYLVNMALNIEGMLWDFPNGGQEADLMWKHFVQTMVKNWKSDFGIAYSVLGSNQKYEQIYMLYSLAMSDTAEVSELRRIFSDHYRNFITRDKEYSQKYGKQILNDYYRRLEPFDGEEVYSAKTDLFYIVFYAKMNIPFADDLIKDVVKNIPYERSTEKNTKLVQNACKYLCNYLKKPIKGKLLLLVIAVAFEDISNASQLNDTFQVLENLTVTGKADMSIVKKYSAERYFERILSNFCGLCERTSDIERLYDLFEMPGDISDIFFTLCARIFMKQSIDEKDYRKFCRFLGIVFEKDSAQTMGSVGKVLCKLNKHKLDDLDKAVINAYRKDKNAIECWKKIKETAESTNPIINSIANIFKRKK